MSIILRVYCQLTRIIGLTNVRYDAVHHRFDLNHTPTILYCLLVNVCCIALMPMALMVLIRFEDACAPIRLLVSAGSVIAASNAFSFVLIIWRSWTTRVLFHRIANAYLRIFQKYRRAIDLGRLEVTTSRYLLLEKVALSFCRLIALFMFLNGRDNVKVCHNRATHSSAYLLSAILIGIVQTLMILVDVNVFLGLLLSDLLLGVLLQELHAIWGDIKFLRQMKRSWHPMWRQQLACHVDRINCQQNRIKSLTDDWISVSGLQALAVLFCWCIVLSVMCFKLLMHLLDMKDFHLVRFLFYLSLILANLCSLMLLFYVCERIYRRFTGMRHVVQQIWLLHASVASGEDCPLTRSLEELSLELQKHNYRLKLCGLFELSLNSGLRMTTSIILHLLIMVQIAISSNDVAIPN